MILFAGAIRVVRTRARIHRRVEGRVLARAHRLGPRTTSTGGLGIRRSDDQTPNRRQPVRTVRQTMSCRPETCLVRR